MPRDDRVRIEVSDHVADVVLVRSDKHNALDWPMFQALDEATDELAEMPEVRAVILRGEGPSFCSGLDFPSFMGADQEIPDLFQHRNGQPANLAQRVTYDWQVLPVPVVAALHGVCYGGGCQLALGADIRFAAPDTRMSLMEMKYGLIPDMGVSQTLPRLVAADVAKELVLTGRVVEAEEAHRLGLVTHLSDDPVAGARELAAEIASRSPHAVRSGKRLVNEVWNAPPETGLALEEALQRELIGSPNQLAAVEAAFTKQPAKFADPA